MKIFQVKVYFYEESCPQVLDTFRSRQMAEEYVETAKAEWNGPNVKAVLISEYWAH